MQKELSPFFLFFIVLILTPNVSAEESYAGLPLEIHSVLLLIAFGFFALMVWKSNEIPPLGFMPALFWFAISVFINKITIYTSDGTAITVMHGWVLTLLFGSIGFFCFIFAIFACLTYAKRSVE